MFQLYNNTQADNAPTLSERKRHPAEFSVKRASLENSTTTEKKNLLACSGSKTLFSVFRTLRGNGAQQMLLYGQPSAVRTQSLRVPSAHGDVAEQSFRALGHTKLASLCDALGMSAQLGDAKQIFDLFGESWALRTRSCSHPSSDITDDSSPFEFSVALEDGHPELRLLAEVQSVTANAMSNWAAAWQLTEQLGRIYGVSLTRAHQIADLFEPSADNSVFGLWHAACLRPGHAPTLKLYLNPRARGDELVDASVKEAFDRLGQSESYEWLREHAMLRGSKDRFAYVSIDLGDHSDVRTKLYVAHHDAVASDVERVMMAVPGHVPGDAVTFCDAMASGPFRQRPLLTCMAFVSGKREPSTCTLHIPIRCYANNDRIVLDRVRRFLSPKEAALHARAVRSMASRRLDAHAGLQTYTSFRRVEGRKRLTVYLSPEVYSSQ
jgi:hypothetical protein